MCRSRRGKKPLSAKGSFRRAALVVLVGAGAMLFVNQRTRPEKPLRPPEPRRLDRLSADSLSAQVALTGAVEAARAADAEVAKFAPPEPPPVPPGVVAARDVPSPGPYTSPEKAKAAAAEVAAQVLTRQLGELESPIRHEVSAAEVLGRYLKAATDKPVPPEELSAIRAQMGSDDEWCRATVSAEITPAQIRELRAASRTLEGIKLSGALAACLGALLAFLALDSLTKGYLSWGLGLGLGGAAIGTVAALFYFV